LLEILAGVSPGTDGTFSDTLSVMARLCRIVVVNIPHHVTQRRLVPQNGGRPGHAMDHRAQALLAFEK